MSQTNLTLTALPETFSVCRLAPVDPIPGWATQGSFFAITHTANELSLVCEAAAVPEGVRAERDWRALKVNGPLDFALVGILAALAAPLAAAGISIFAISTYDTDYLLVRAERLRDTIEALRTAGHTVIPSILERETNEPD